MAVSHLRYCDVKATRFGILIGVVWSTHFHDLDYAEKSIGGGSGNLEGDVRYRYYK